MKIYAPNKQYSNISAGVMFKNGVGETDNPRLIDWFREHGYVVEADEVINDAADADADADADAETAGDHQGLIFDSIDKTDVDQLKAYAEQEHIDIGQSTSARGILQKIVSAKKQEG